mmetsp:Transcript_29207/g.44026  ORF Transcript_29207/g.44026 Transcript_29207/m.44026 type:complete len:238 (-) Transcript_29207:1336-2049(-)
MLLPLGSEFAPRPQLLLCVLEQALAESANAVVDVLQSEDVTLSRSESFDLRASVLEPGHELLQVLALVDRIQMAQRVHFVVESDCELLEGVHVGINLLRLILQAVGQRSCFVVEDPHSCLDEVPLNFSLVDYDFGPLSEDGVHHDLPLHRLHLFFQSLDLELLGLREVLVGDLALVDLLEPCDLILQVLLGFTHLLVGHGCVIARILGFLHDVLLLEHFPEVLFQEDVVDLGSESGV